MDRRLILAVAGSGKTTFLINTLDLDKRYLIVTYTENNVAHIRRCIINKFGYIPTNIKLLSYFQFLIHICYRPFLKDRCNAKGITWRMPENWTLYKKGQLHYMTSYQYLYHNRIAKLCATTCKDMIKDRIEKYYDYFMFDEVQDLGGHDFNLIQAITPTKINCLFVGDFYQHTFDTSKDGNVNKNLYKNYKKFKSIWSKAGIAVDESTLSNSYRCSKVVCDFVSQHLSIYINSHRMDYTKIIWVDNEEYADAIFCDNSKVKLFYNEANKYRCFAENWSKSKGIDSFQDVCIVLNATTLNAYHQKKLHMLAPSTLNKLYVAFTRAKGDIYLVPHVFTDKFKL